MDATTFVTMVGVRTASHHILPVEAAFWLIAIPRQSSQPRAAYTTEPLSRRLLQRYRKSLAALGGKSWTPAVDCVAGKSIVISARTNLWGRANYKAGLVQLLLNTLTLTRESSIDVKPFTLHLIVASTIVFWLSRVFWRFALGHYSSASS